MTTTLPCRRLLPWVLFILLTTSTVADAQHVQWRTDYNAARKEAAEKRKPLLLDFGTNECRYCRQLDASTFRDPSIITLLNEQFVPLKIDGNREPLLVQMLRIQAYPTLILAGSDGRIVGTIEGFIEAGPLQEQLQRVLAVTSPDWMARDFQEASKAIAAADFAKAVTLLQGIMEDGKDRPIQTKARLVLNELEQQASGKLSRAKQMSDRGQSAEAIEQLTCLLRDYAGTQAAKDGAKLLTVLGDQPEVRTAARRTRARELLAQARDDFRSERFSRCLDHCETLTAAYSDLAEAAEAKVLAAGIRNDPVRMSRVAEQLTDKLAAAYLETADAHLKKGNAREAAHCLEQSARLAPGTLVGESAQMRLLQLRKGSLVPAQQTGFAKP